MKILFVEDNARFARVAVTSFLAEHEIRIVAEVATALRVLQEESFDALLVDYDLPDGKGASVVKFAASVVPAPFIVAVSSHDVGNAALKEAGANEICSKMRFSSINAILKTGKL